MKSSLGKSSMVHGTRNGRKLACGRAYNDPVIASNPKAITCGMCRFVLKLPTMEHLNTHIFAVHAPDVFDGTSVTLCGVPHTKAGGIASESKEITCPKCQKCLRLIRNV